MATNIQTKQKLTILSLVVFLFFKIFLPTLIFAQDYENSPFGFHPAHVGIQNYPNNGFIDAQYIGVRWHRPSIYAFWAVIQPDINNPTLDFSMYDNIYGDVPEGINILANIAPQGIIDEGYCHNGSYLPIDSVKYVHFVKSTVERYDGDGIDDMPGLINPIKYWQVGNEPIASNPEDFAELQQITYQAIKEACQDCKVLIGGVSQPLTQSGFTVDREEYFDWFSIFYKPILEDLNGEYVDIFDFHWFGNATGDYRYCGEVTDSLKVILANNNFGDIPFWITEMGSYSGDPIEACFDYQTESQQASDYVKRFVFPLSIGVKKIFPAFGLMEGFIHNDGYFDHNGLIYDGQESNDLGLGIKKLGYFTYKLMTEKLEGSDFDNIQTIQELDNIYVYKFMKNGEPIYVAWWDYYNDTTYTIGDSKLITLSNISSNQVIVTNAVPNDTSGISIIDYNTAFQIDTLNVSNSSVSFYIKEKPVFIEEYNTTSVNEINQTNNRIKIYPNPSKGIFSVEGENIQSVEILNIIGQTIKQLLTDNEQCIIDLSKYPKGVYFIKIVINEERLIEKVILE